MLEKPNFFIVGTPKGGTTSLFHYLEGHSNIFIPNLKEPHYFSCPEVKDTYYKTTIIADKAKYLQLFEKSKLFKAVGDLSTSYLFNPNSAHRIKEFNPDAKIVVVLRNPVDRAISHYLMDRSLGYIDVPLKIVLKKRKKYAQFYEEYIEMGFYEAQIKRYKKLFDPSQLLILLSDELFFKTRETLTKIHGFLGVEDVVDIDFNEKHNAYKEPRFGTIKKILLNNNAKIIIEKIPKKFKNRIKTLLYKKDIKKPELDLEKRFLKRLYREDIKKTAVLTGKDLSTWL